jgi:prepilin-type N-terminal cleavage/methylation domain-containing protein
MPNMHAAPCLPPRRSDAGFSLVEMMISMTLMLVILGGTFGVMQRAFGIEKTVRDMSVLAGNMRAAMDLLTRDMSQVGQGLPIARIVGIPNGAGATTIARPGPGASGACTGVTGRPFNATTAVSSIAAVTPGPNLGPPVNGVCTDVVTTLAVDSAFEAVGTSAIPNSTSLVVYRRGLDGVLGNADDVIISDNPDVLGDNVRAGDFLMVYKGDYSTLVAVTAVGGDTITFGADALGLNQAGAAQGTLNWVRTRTTADATVVTAARSASSVSRIRMITYFIDVTDPTSPRLMRQINANAPTTVAFDIETFVLNYDLASDTGTWAYVEMNPADVNTTGGRCSPLACSPNTIRKTNLTLSGRTQSKVAATGYYRSALTSQVALRSLAFVDKY